MILTIKAPLRDLKETSDYLGCHLWQAFEDTEMQDYEMFIFVSGRNQHLIIEVRSNELFKRETKIIEI